MRLKGTTKIELTNVKTGKKEVYTHDNFVTEFAAEYFRECGALNTNPVGNLNDAYPLDALFGGIMLFDTPIDAQSDDTGRYTSPIYCPAGVKMTANASSDFSSNSNATELGQYNAGESYANDHERSYVYNWDTNEGNGIIGSVCLTSQIGGYIGAGNATSETFDNTSKNVNLFDLRGTNPTNRTLTTTARDRLATMSVSRGQVALLEDSPATSLNNGRVVIKWYDAPISKLNPFISKLAFDETAMTPRATQTINITPHVVSAARVLGGPGYILLVGSNTGNTSTGSVVYATQIDAQGNVTEKVYNIASTTNSIPLSGYYPMCGKIMPDNALYLGYKNIVSWTSYCVHSYIPTNGVTKDISYKSGQATGRALNALFGVYGGRIQLSDTAYYDPVLDKVLLTNSKQSSFASANSGAYTVPCFDSYHIFNPSSDKQTSVQYPTISSLGMWRMPCNWLSTINNLDTPVEKTSDKWMQVTYTLTLQD